MSGEVTFYYSSRVWKGGAVIIYGKVAEIGQC